MSAEEKKFSISNDVTPVPHDVKGIEGVRRADNVLLAKLGYRSEFKREFSVSLCSTMDGRFIPTRNKAYRDSRILLFHHGRYCLCVFDLYFPPICR